MTTQAQIDANRTNAQKSTGPKSAAGKDRVAKNALKHGLLARRFFIGPDQRTDFENFRRTLIDDMNPVGALQSAVVDRIADLTWRLRQSQAIYENILNALIERITKYPNYSLRPQKLETPQEVEGVLLGNAAIDDFAGAKILDRLALYEQRIERSLCAARKEFRTLRSVRAKEELITAKAMDNCDNINDTPPAGYRQPTHSDQTNPIAPRRRHTTHFQEYSYNRCTEVPAEKTNPIQTPASPAPPYPWPENTPATAIQEHPPADNPPTTPPAPRQPARNTTPSTAASPAAHPRSKHNPTPAPPMRNRKYHKKLNARFVFEKSTRPYPARPL